MNQGLYRSEGMQVFVSQGAGTFGPRMRLGSSNELDVLKSNQFDPLQDRLQRLIADILDLAVAENS